MRAALRAAALALLALAACRGRAPEAWVEPEIGIELVRIPAGEFWMGSPPDEPGHEEQEVRHRVAISQPFYLGRYEVTQDQWHRVMGSRPSRFAGCGGDCPVERVSYHDVEAFLARLNGISGERFRLPSEAEWEYACRAGTETPFATGRSLSSDQANYDGRYPLHGDLPGRYRGAPAPVGSYPPNPWGLYDLHGNLWEWTSDWHCPYAVDPAGPVRDPHAACDTELKVIRGGSWYFNEDSARCGVRYTHRPQDLGFSLGFRVALSARTSEP